MGEVFLAHDDQLGRNIAIKLLPAEFAADAEHLSRLRNEARSASSLNHPNIVTIYEIGRDDSARAFMAMEYVDGQTLRDLMRGGAMPVRKALQIAAQLADGLAAAHKRGLVHRDLKPENIMITSDGVVKVLDFGLAKSLDVNSDTNVSEPGMLVGTYGYMSPEQARAGDIDYRSDQFSFGSILYEMLTGNRAFDGASGVETLFMVVRDEAPPLSVVAAHVPAPLRWVVDRCLSKDPEDRYVATRDLARDLQYIRDHFSEAGVATPIREKDTVATRVRKHWPAAVAVVLALVAGIAVTAWVRRPAPRVITSERYLTYSGTDYSPAVSPDGKLIAFSSARDGVQRIWIKQVAGGGEVALTAGIDDFPRFTPDGSAVLYIHADPQHPTNAASLWRVAVVGGEPRRVLDDVTTADLSHDGSKLAFIRPVQENGVARGALFVSDANGTNARELMRSDIGASHPRWSPDNKSLAIVISRGGRVTQAVVIVDAATGNAKELSAPAKAGELSSVIWTADGRSVIYVRAHSVEAVVGSTALVMRHDVRKDEAETVGWTSHNGLVLDSLQDGTLVFDVRSPRDNLREVSLNAAANAPQERWLTRGNSSDRQPAYAPDGKTVLFSSNRSGNLDLWSIATDGGTVRRITDDNAEDWDPAFTPDGKKIVWSSGRSGNLEIWIANADGSEAKQISHDGNDAENPTATADGQWIVYNSFNPVKAGIWKVRPDGTQATQVVKARTSLPEVSPDGQYVSYLFDARTLRTQVRVARVSDGQDMGISIPIRNVRRTSAILGRTRWTPDGKSIAFLGQNDEGVNGVFLQDFVPGRDTSATKRAFGGFDRERATESFGISPDGSILTVAGWEQLFSLFSIEGVPGVSRNIAQKES
jgi:Tol biopolymer transport system component